MSLHLFTETTTLRALRLLHDLLQRLVHEDAHDQRRPPASPAKLRATRREALRGPRSGLHEVCALAEAAHGVGDAPRLDV